MEHHTSKFTQGLNMPVLSIIAIVGTLVVWVTVVATQAYYETGVRLEEQKKLVQPDYLAENRQVAALLAEQHQHLAGIEDAKAAVVAQYGGTARPQTPAQPRHTPPGH